MVPTATSVGLAANLVSAPVMIALRMSRRTASAARMARPAKGMPEANVAHLVVTAAKAAISVALVVRRPSERATAIPEASRPTVNAAKTAKPAKAMPEANVAQVPGTVGKRVPSATQAANPPSEFATVAPEVFRRTVRVARTARPARAMQEVNVARALGTVGKRVLSVVQAASLPLAFATAAPEASVPTESAAARTARPARDIPKASAVHLRDSAARTVASAVQVVNLLSVSAILAPEASQPTESAGARMARRARATRRANVAQRMAFVALPLISAPLAARVLLANAMLGPALSRPMEFAVARTDGSAKAMLTENAVANRAFVALRLLSAVLVARMHSACVTAVQAPSQRISNALPMARPARALPMAIAAVPRIIAVKRPLIVALDGKWTQSYTTGEKDPC